MGGILWEYSCKESVGASQLSLTVQVLFIRISLFPALSLYPLSSITGTRAIDPGHMATMKMEDLHCVGLLDLKMESMLK